MKLFILSIISILSLPIYGSENNKPFYEKDSLVTIDYSSIWLSKQDDFIGYIGDNYQRFRIRFLTIEQNENDKSVYSIRGKTMVKNIICDFTGEIQVKEVRIFKTNPRRKAVIRAEYSLAEDPSQNHSGIFKGKLTSYVYWKDEKVLFDDLGWGRSDPYHNNQFEGKWSDYKTGKSKKCNWGIARIPNSRELDMGAAEFSPDPLFDENGWDTYPDGGTSSNPIPYEEQLERDRPKWW